MDKKIEYESLREEIMKSMQIVKEYRSIMYTIVVATLAFAFNKGIAILFLVPFSAIIPIYLLSMHQIDSVLRLGAYIYVFLEPETECKWETRLYEYDVMHKNQYSTKKISIDSYWCVSFCCLIRFRYSGFRFLYYVFYNIINYVFVCFLFYKEKTRLFDG